MLAFIGLAIASPLILLTAVATKLTSKGPVFFRQSRVGKNGVPFEFLKLRTMRAAATGPQITAGTDTRITTVGRILRKSKLDELPGLWNVLKGDLSLVGPRPEVPRFVDMTDARWRFVLLARPGLTDPMTLRLRNEEDLLAQATGDVETFYRTELLPVKLHGYRTYLESRTSWEDIKVLARTFVSVVLRHSAPAPTASVITSEALQLLQPEKSREAVSNSSYHHLRVVPRRRSEEARLLLLCSRTVLDSETLAELQNILNFPLDWEYVVRKAREHAIVPLIFRSLNRVKDAVPPNVLTSLTREVSHHARRNLLITRHLLNLLSIFEQNGISAVAYKGPILSAVAYGDLALRTFNDLDILVHENEILRAKELLISRGFSTAIQLSETEESAHLRSCHQKDIVLVHPDLPVRVELHWRIASLFLFPLDSETLWNRMEKVNIAGQTVANFSPEDMLFILCVHGAKHSFRRLQWIADIAELIRANPTLDWDELSDCAKTLRCFRMVSLGLVLAGELYGATVPERMLRMARSDAKVESMANRVLATLFSDEENNSILFTDDVTFRVNLRERWVDRTRLRISQYKQKLHLTVTPNQEDRKLLRLPGSLSAFYYISRPVRLAYVYGVSRLLSNGRKDHEAGVVKSKAPSQSPAMSKTTQSE